MAEERKSEQEYPIKKFDNLNRLIYVDWNGYERVAKSYWRDTKKLKVRYTYFGKDLSVDVYDEKGQAIITSTSNSFEVNMKGLKLDAKGVCEFVVDKNILDMWKKKSNFKPVIRAGRLKGDLLNNLNIVDLKQLLEAPEDRKWQDRMF